MLNYQRVFMFQILLIFDVDFHVKNISVMFYLDRKQIKLGSNLKSKAPKRPFVQSRSKIIAVIALTSTPLPGFHARRWPGPVKL
jgi:hypothetical protein